MSVKTEISLSMTYQRKTKKFFTDEMINYIQHEYNKGVPSVKIASDINCLYSTLLKHIKRNPELYKKPEYNKNRYKCDIKSCSP